MSFDPKTALGLQMTALPSAILSRPQALARDPETTGIAELDRVTISRDVEGEDGEHVPAGSSGTVVAIWAGGAAYEVEFATPISALATVKADAISAHIRR